MENLPNLADLAKKAKMYHTAANLKEILEKAKLENLSNKDFLQQVLYNELNERQKRYDSHRIARSLINPLNTIEVFDFSKIENEDIKQKIRVLSSGKFVDSHDNILLLGGHGVGKTHLGDAFVNAVCSKGKRGISNSVKTMCRNLVIAYREGCWKSVAKPYLNYDVLFLRDLGTVTLSRDEVDVLYEIIDYRTSRHSTIIESAVSTKEWKQVFEANRGIITGILDRLLYNCHKIQLDGKSYRLKDISQN
jgi:DNA replication protein DnaC